MQTQPTRDIIIEQADQLFYQQGFEHTSFTDIAAAVKISRGNFYYHFKTKDEILAAVIQHRLAKTAAMLAQWESEAQSTVARILCFIEILIRNQANIMRYGCPVGTLCAELAKLNHAATSEANLLLGLFRDWLCRQFLASGCDEAAADRYAMHLLGRSQGVATLANAFDDDQFIHQEVQQMSDWLRATMASIQSY